MALLMGFEVGLSVGSVKFRQHFHGRVVKIQLWARKEVQKQATKFENHLWMTPTLG